MSNAHSFPKLAALALLLVTAEVLLYAQLRQVPTPLAALETRLFLYENTSDPMDSTEVQPQDPIYPVLLGDANLAVTASLPYDLNPQSVTSAVSATYNTRRFEILYAQPQSLIVQHQIISYTQLLVSLSNQLNVYGPPFITLFYGINRYTGVLRVYNSNVITRIETTLPLHME